MTLRVPRRLAHVEIGRSDVDAWSPRVYLRLVPGGENLALEGTAALIWQVAVSGAGDIVGDVAEIVGEAPDVVRAPIEAYLDFLLRNRLLTRGEAGPT